MHDNPGLVSSLTDRVGAQAIVAAFPVARSGDALQWYDHRQRTEVQLTDDALKPLLNGEISEALVVDWRHEGVKNGFDPVLLEPLAARLRHVPLLAYGGISEPEQIRPLLGNPAVAAVCVGNFLNYREHAVQELKRAVVDAPLRPPVFAKEAL
jgi:cyclase